MSLENISTIMTLIQGVTVALLIPLFKYSIALEKRLVIMDMEIKHLKDKIK